MRVELTSRWRTVFVATRTVAAGVAVILLVLRPADGGDLLLGALGVAYAGATCLAVARVPAVAGAAAFWVLDIGVSLALIAEAGDWRSPFYLFLLSALVLPSTGLSPCAIARPRSAARCRSPRGTLNAGPWSRWRCR
jgi:hypothetical protein